MSHISPKSSELKYAVCIPSSCQINDAKIILQNNLESYSKDMPIKIKIKSQLREEMCQIKIESGNNGRGTKIVWWV